MELTAPLASTTEAGQDEALARLRASGRVPAPTTRRPIDAVASTLAVSTKALAVAPVFAHLDPRHPYQDGKASLETSYAAWFNCGASPAFVRVGNNTGTGYPFLGMTFSGLGANTEAVVTLDLKIIGSNDVLEITASGNPVTMTVSFGAMGGQRGTVMVPLKANSAGTADVYIFLPPPVNGDGHLYDWFGADLRKL